MTYRVQLTRQAVKQLQEIPQKDQQRIKQTLRTMASDPLQGDVVKLVGYAAFRRRIGQYRIVFSVHEGEVVVLIVAILRRNEKTYKKL
jgi:mRNA interferase RelE/StbE